METGAACTVVEVRGSGARPPDAHAAVIDYPNQSLFLKAIAAEPTR